MQFRTDLAIEAREIAGENTGGIEFKKYSENGLEISRLIVKNQKARQALGKEIGTYITIELPSLTDNFTETDKRLETVGNEIKRLLPVNGLCACCRTRQHGNSLPTHSDRKQADGACHPSHRRRNCPFNGT